MSDSLESQCACVRVSIRQPCSSSSRSYMEAESPERVAATRTVGCVFCIETILNLVYEKAMHSYVAYSDSKFVLQ